MRHRLARFRVALQLANLSVEVFAARVNSNCSLLLRMLKRRPSGLRQTQKPSARKLEVLAAVDKFIADEFRHHQEILDLERCP